jgi:hypothetical protein
MFYCNDIFHIPSIETHPPIFEQDIQRHPPPYGYKEKIRYPQLTCREDNQKKIMRFRYSRLIHRSKLRVERGYIRFVHGQRLKKSYRQERPPPWFSRAAASRYIYILLNFPHYSIYFLMKFHLLHFRIVHTVVFVSASISVILLAATLNCAP